MTLLALVAVALVMAPTAEADTDCSPCESCLECYKCKSPCETLCSSPLCSGCTTIQDDGSDCFGTAKDTSWCQWNCGPECASCSHCDACVEDCKPCNSTLCQSDDCQMPTLIHDACTGGNQCDDRCLKLCDPCLNCNRCAECRDLCGHCDECWKDPNSTLCKYDDCDQCKPCQPCQLCDFMDDSPCDPCEICLIAHKDDEGEAVSMTPVATESVPATPVATEDVAAAPVETEEIDSGEPASYQVALACIAGVVAVSAMLLGTVLKKKVSTPVTASSTEKEALASKGAAYGALKEEAQKVDGL